MKISIVIPAYNEEKNINQCLKAIIKETKVFPNFNFEIIVVNNASTDKTEEIAKSFPEVLVVNENRKGIVWARQAGFLASTGELIANIDADTIILPGWFDKVFDEFTKNNNLVALSGPYIYHDLSAWTNFLVKMYYFGGYILYLITHYIFHFGAMLQGGNYVVRRDALEKIGGFDTSIKFYGEDTDIARRIIKVGKTKFDFNFKIISSGRRLENEGFFRMAFRYGLNYFWIIIFKKPFTDTYKDIRPK